LVQVRFGRPVSGTLIGHIELTARRHAPSLTFLLRKFRRRQLIREFCALPHRTTERVHRPKPRKGPACPS
jgi:hypothetical protein